MKQSGCTRIRRQILYVLLIATLGFDLALPRISDARNPPPPYVPGELLVRYRSPLARKSIDGPGLQSRLQPGALTKRPESLQKLDERHGLATSRSLTRPNAIAPRPSKNAAADAARKRTRQLIDSTEVLQFDPGADVRAIAAEYSKDPNVLIAEPNFRGTLTFDPTDAYFASQAADFAQVGFQTAWDSQPIGDPNVTVAVIDSGCDLNHEDLVGVISPAAFDFVNNTSEMTDNQGHGTRMSTLIAAASNGIGMAGGAFGVTILPLKVVANDGTLSQSSVLSAVSYALDHGVAIINMSFTFAEPGQMLADALREASATAVLVAAVGNEGRNDARRYPAAYDGVVGVAASAEGTTARANFSNYNGLANAMADLAAPGETIFSGIPGSEYDGVYASGTSFSAAIVSAAAALLKSSYPDQSACAIQNHLLRTADLAAAPYTNNGFLNVANAIETPMLPNFAVASVRIDDNPAFSGANDGDGALDVGETVDIYPVLVNGGADGTSITATLATSDLAVTTPPDDGAWPDIECSMARQATTPFRITVAALPAVARDAGFTLSISADGGFSQEVGFAIPIQVEEPIPSIPPFGFTLTADKTWVADGQINIFGDFSIEPGTTIKCKENANFEVLGGRFTAVGTTESLITFRPFLESSDDPLLVDGNVVLAKAAGGTLANESTGDMAVLPEGSIVVVGVYDGPTVFGAGEGNETPLPFAGGADGFVARFNPDGTLMWAKSLGGESYDFAQSVAALADGPIFVTGNFYGSAIFNDALNSVTLTAAGGPDDADIFVARYESDGSLAWARSAGGAGYDSGISVFASASPDRHCFVAGVFSAEATFGADDNPITLNSAGEQDAFIAKYNENGQLLWAKSAGGASYDAANGVSSLSDGGAALTGFFGGSATFNPGEDDETIDSAGDQDVFVARYTSTGTLDWVRRAGGADGPDGANDIAAFPDDSLALAGNFFNSATFGAGDPGETTLTSNGNRDIFVAKYLSDGTLQWARSAGGPGQFELELVSSVAVLPGGGCVASGFVRTPALFGRNESGETTLTSDNSLLQFVASYLPNGQLAWVKGIDTPSVQTVAAAGDGSIWMAGSFVGSVILGSGEPGQTVLASGEGTSEVFFAKLFGAPHWNSILVRNSSGGAEFENCRITGGQVVNESDQSSFLGSSFRRSPGTGLTSSAGSSDVVQCVASLNGGEGMVLGGRNAIDSEASRNRLGGLVTTGTLTRCHAFENGSDGLSGGRVEYSTAILNNRAGILASAGVAFSLSHDNGARGVVCTADDVTSVTAINNGGTGIEITGGGTASLCVARNNGGAGMLTNGSFIDSCLIENNLGPGVVGVSPSYLVNSRVIGNAGAGITGVENVLMCAVADNGMVNGGGIAGALTVQGAYVFNNNGTGVGAGTVTDSTIVSNTDNGILNPSAVFNSWIMRNIGVGILGNGTAAVYTSTIADNFSGGVENLLNMNLSNIFGNQLFDARDRQVRQPPAAAPFVKDFTQNHWSDSVTTRILSSLPGPLIDIDPEILDGRDYGSFGWFLNYGDPLTEDPGFAPDTTPPAFLVSVSPETANPIGPGVETFTLVFSKPMDTSVDPTVSFSLNPPFTERLVVNDPSWIDDVTWQGSFLFDFTTGGGTNSVRVSGATDSAGFVIPDDVTHQFVFDLSGETVANNGIATRLGANGTVTLTWPGIGSPGSLTPLGAGSVNGFNVLRDDSYGTGRYRSKRNGNVIENPGAQRFVTFTDTGLTPPYDRYRWRIKRVTTGSSDFYGKAYHLIWSDAQAVGHTIPARLAPGLSAGVGVTFKNIGYGINWRSESEIALTVIQDDCGLIGAQVIEVPKEIVVNDSHQFIVQLTAPMKEGLCTIQFQMLERASPDNFNFGEILTVDVDIAPAQNAALGWEMYE